jgi:hypothetical protein
MGCSPMGLSAAINCTVLTNRGVSNDLTFNARLVSNAGSEWHVDGIMHVRRSRPMRQDSIQQPTAHADETTHAPLG